MRVLIFSFVFVLMLISCKPAQKGTDFNILISPLVGADALYVTQEDAPIEIKYRMEKGEDAISPWINLATEAKNGRVSNCSFVDGIEVSCLYTPNKDFNGQDSFQLQNGDGQLVAGSLISLKIDVTPVPDPPSAYNKSFSGKTNEVLVFDLPLGVDPDSSNDSLSYLVNPPSSGELNCNKRACTYNPPHSFVGKISFTYIVKDESDLRSENATIEMSFSKEVYRGDALFNQTSVKGVDIVWCIDDSGSMSDNQEKLKASFESFVDKMINSANSNFDFSMAVTTTGAYHSGYDGKNGVFRRDSSNNVYALTKQRAVSNRENFKKDFLAAVDVGTSGNAIEKALSSVYRSFSTDASWYGGNDKALVFILVSDEVEQSTERTIENWNNTLRLQKDHPQKVKVFSIFDPSVENSEKRYTELSRLFGTNPYDIKSGSFDKILEDIGQATAYLGSSFFLDQTHDVIESTLKVYVNNQLKQLNIDYRYENQTLIFLDPPSEGSIIRAEYDYTIK